MNFDASNPALVGVDWGTSSFRAYLIDSQGVVLDSMDSSDGIMQVANRDFDSVLIRLLEPWCKFMDLPIIASGMITSRNGWFETPYLSVPVSAHHLAGSLESQRSSTDLDVHFVTGVKSQTNGAPDVMRGEEIQLVGVIETELIEGIVVMPGTHSKWVTVRNGCIEDFATFMSGEIFAALSNHTILGTLMKDSGFQKQVFLKGVAAGFDAGTQLLHRLFHVRTLPLFGLIAENETSDYLSGMLIGAEIRGATHNSNTIDQITIVGRDSLALRYASALEALEISVVSADNTITARGHFAVATSAGLIK